MIYGLLNQGSGAGNQLFRYIALRIRALDLGVDYRLVWNPDGSGKPDGFKCKDFMSFDESKVVLNWPRGTKEWHEKKIVDSTGVDTRGFDPEYFFVEDETLIEGELQDSRYWEHREKEVDEWLKVEPLEMPDDLCVVGFRGGEFALYPDLFLTKEYYEEAIAKMRKINPNMRFEVHTDDKPLAEEFFKDFLIYDGIYWELNNIWYLNEHPIKHDEDVSWVAQKDISPFVKVIHDIGINWRSMRFAKYAIITNSSFFILPRWLNKGLTYAPRYWGRRNTRVWSLPQNYYKRFQYL